MNEIIAAAGGAAATAIICLLLCMRRHREDPQDTALVNFIEGQELGVLLINDVWTIAAEGKVVTHGASLRVALQRAKEHLK